jgi:hypothetical protein
MSDGQQTTDEIYALIRQAISNKNVVIASYHGYVREMCPHVIGKKNGQAHVFLYQFAGGSGGGLEPDGSPANWRCLRMNELSQVSVEELAGNWHTASNYSEVQSCVDEIDIKVDLR